MNTKQSNKLASYGAIEALLQATPEVSSVTGLPEKLETLSAKVAEINSLATTQTQPYRASAVARDQLLDQMADQAVEIAGLITTLARDTNAPDLAETVEVGRSSFRRARRSHRQWFAQRVLDTAKSVLPQIAAYGVTAETLDAFKARIDAAVAGMHAARGTAVDKTAATRRLVDLFVEVDELLDDKIDRLVFGLRRVLPDFDARYEAAREIIDRRGSRRPPGEVPTPSVLQPAARTTTVSTDQRAA